MTRRITGRLTEVVIDDRAEKAMMKRFREPEIDRVMKYAATVGARQGAAYLRGQAPVGMSDRPSQYYRARNLKHGTFRRSVRAAPIRGRGSAMRDLQGRTIGVVMGPLGKNAFTRNWIEEGTEGPGKHRVEGKHWTARAAGESLRLANDGADRVFAEYGRE